MFNILLNSTCMAVLSGSVIWLNLFLVTQEFERKNKFSDLLNCVLKMYIQIVALVIVIDYIYHVNTQNE